MRWTMDAIADFLLDTGGSVALVARSKRELEELIAGYFVPHDDFTVRRASGLLYCKTKRGFLRGIVPGSKVSGFLFDLVVLTSSKPYPNLQTFAAVQTRLTASGRVVYLES